MDGTAELLDIDRRYLVHPLHHRRAQAPLFVTEAAAMLTGDGRGSSTGRPAVENVNIGAWRGELPARAGRRCAASAFASSQCRRHERAGDPPQKRSSGTPTATAGHLTSRTAGRSRTNLFKFAPLLLDRLWIIVRALPHDMRQHRHVAPGQ